MLLLGKTTMKVIATAAIFSLLFGGIVYAETMTAAQIDSELIGKTLCVKSKAGGNICVKHNAGGKSVVVSGGEKQTGVWRYEGNQHCSTWQKIRKGKEMCSTFEKTGAKYSNSFSGPIQVK
jgi:frataxin-like iron-binding protein CyaY